MSGVAIYVEGGHSSDDKSLLRIGMDEFLKDLKDRARAGRWRWKVVFCGSRRETYEAFMNARAHAGAGDVTMLLVDSEAPVVAVSRIEHLTRRREDGWDLAGVDEADVHLMVQTMETWIVADPDALARYYGNGFRGGRHWARRRDLEAMTKEDIYRSLRISTDDTRKGEYHKIAHASELLRLIDPETVRARCRRCREFMDQLRLRIG